jgi:hypothetical protein
LGLVFLVAHGGAGYGAGTSGAYRIGNSDPLARAVDIGDRYYSIVLDSRRPEVDGRTHRVFERLQREGTPYLGHGRIVDSLLLGSHHSLGLHVADLVVGSSSPPAAIEGVGLVKFPRAGEGRDAAAEQAAHRMRRRGVRSAPARATTEVWQCPSI